MAEKSEEKGKSDDVEQVAGVKRSANTTGDDGTAQKKIAADEKQTVKGSCHCGITNLLMESPDADFKLVSPDSKDELGNYKANSDDGHRYFCPKCSVLVWTQGSYDMEGQHFDFFAINVSTIDQPQEGVDLNDFALTYWNGLHDGWKEGMKESPYPGGLL